MALLEFDIPEGALWGDYFYETESDSGQTLEYNAPESDGEEWETVGQPKVKEEEHKAPPKWCRDGNACQWKNCKFRHERCSHYDKWLARGKKGHNCRCHATDPQSNKRPDEGGCMYDHRDLSKLKMFVETVPCSNESEIWENFIQRGLEGHCADIYDVSAMARLDRALLVRSLTAANVKFEDHDEWFEIWFNE